MSNTAWILSDDSQLYAALRHDLQQNGVRDVTVLSPAISCNDLSQGDSVGWVFADLRQGLIWQRLLDFFDWLPSHLPESCVWIAVTENGYPLEHASLAHATFSAALPASFSSCDVQQVLTRTFSPSDAYFWR